MTDPPALEDVYDPRVVLAIDGRGPEPGRPAARPLAASALTAALLRGIDEVLDDGDDDEPVIEVADDDAAHYCAVEVFLAWGQPAASVAVVRPWLL